MRIAVSAALAFAALSTPAFADSGSPTLDAIKARGHLMCGVSDGLAGFSNPDSQGNWSGLDVDFCRAIAAAIFDDPNAVRFTPSTAKERFTALQSGEFDLLSRNTTWTMQRDIALGFTFAGIIYYDGQGFIVRGAEGVTSALQLQGATVCTQSGTTTELNIADYFTANNLAYELLTFDKEAEALQAYDEGRCDAYTTDQSGLYAARLELRNAGDHIILPEIISKEPLGPLVRQGDDRWADIVRWTLFAQINAEELGVTSGNVGEMTGSANPEIRRLLGVEGEFGASMGLTNDWAVRIIRHLGNYGEMFERNVGEGSTLKIARGINALWNRGGLQYAPPVR